MSGWKRLTLLRAGVPLAVFAASGAVALTELSPSALASPITPPSATSCSGSITPDADAGAGNPNGFDYQFRCVPAITGGTADSGYTWNFTGDIWSYAIAVTRRNDDGDNVTYEAPTANVLTSPGVVDGSQYVNCSSFIPSDGFTCTDPGPGASTQSDLANGTNPAYLSYIPGGETVTGGFALAHGYCSYLPKRAKPGTPAVPRATVELIVTDTNGVTEGPFELNRTGRCPKVAAVVPAKKKKAVKKKKAKEAEATRRHALKTSR